MNTLKADSMPKGIPIVILNTKYALEVLSRTQRLPVFKVEWQKVSYVIYNGVAFCYYQRQKPTEGDKADG
jgi:hypothetical protein